MSIKKNSCLFVIALTALFFAAEALAQTPAGEAGGKTSAAQAAPQQNAQSGAVTASADAAQPDAEDAGMVKDIMRKFRESYHLGPDDELSIKVLKQPDYSLDKVKVSPLGTIYHNLLGEIPVAGMTIDQLKKQLTNDLSEYVIDPTVYVELLEAHSAKIGVIGEVLRPGILLMSRPMTVLDAIEEAGGFNDFGKKSAVTVLRQPLDGNKQMIEVNVKEILKGKGKPEENIALQAGDTVIVRGNAMKTLSKISTVTGFASLLSFIAVR